MISQSRRDFLNHTGAGFASVALSAMLAEELRAENSAKPDIDAMHPLAERLPHVAPKAKQVIFLFQYGGPATFDLLDHKPELIRLNGQPVPESFKKNPDKVGGVFNHCKDELMAGPWRWSQHGQSEQWVSELLPHTAKHIDKLCQVRSMFSESSNHAPATYLMNTGAILGGKPSLGSWTTYGLGSINQNLPGYVLLYKVGGLGGSANWSNAFLPAAFQGTQFRHEGSPVLNLQPPGELADVQRSTLDFAQALNRRHAAQRPGVLDLDGRIASYELAYRMQSSAPEALDLASEPKHIQDLYGIGDERCDHFARQCLTARRLVERGVRFVQIYSGGMENQRSWDGHSDIEGNHRQFAGETDKPVAGLLSDMAASGLLNDTLVVWCGEFGRLPIAQTGGKPGRDHNPHHLCAWLAGGGVKGGVSYGNSDDIGYKSVENRVHINDLHATILHLLGMDHEKLTYKYNGRRFRLTDVGGHVIQDILS